MVQELEQEKGEVDVGMTDTQFLAYKEMWDKREAELLQELQRLREAPTSQSGEGMTDLQFQGYRELQNKLDAMRDERDALARQLAQLRGTQDVSNEPMTDFQYKQLIEMIYQIVKTNHEAGKSVDEILAIIATLRDGKA